MNEFYKINFMNSYKILEIQKIKQIKKIIWILKNIKIY